MNSGILMKIQGTLKYTENQIKMEIQPSRIWGFRKSSSARVVKIIKVQKRTGDMTQVVEVPVKQVQSPQFNLNIPKKIPFKWSLTEH
jgi:hypothetical protein